MPNILIKVPNPACQRLARDIDAMAAQDFFETVKR
jgi:hypothetical protein